MLEKFKSSIFRIITLNYEKIIKKFFSLISFLISKTFFLIKFVATVLFSCSHESNQNQMFNDRTSIRNTKKSMIQSIGSFSSNLKKEEENIYNDKICNLDKIGSMTTSFHFEEEQSDKSKKFDKNELVSQDTSHLTVSTKRFLTYEIHIHSAWLYAYSDIVDTIGQIEKFSDTYTDSLLTNELRKYYKTYVDKKVFDWNINFKSLYDTKSLLKKRLDDFKKTKNQNSYINVKEFQNGLHNLNLDEETLLSFNAKIENNAEIENVEFTHPRDSKNIQQEKKTDKYYIAIPGLCIFDWNRFISSMNIFLCGNEQHASTLDISDILTLNSTLFRRINDSLSNLEKDVLLLCKECSENLNYHNDDFKNKNHRPVQYISGKDFLAPVKNIIVGDCETKADVLNYLLEIKKNGDKFKLIFDKIVQKKNLLLDFYKKNIIYNLIHILNNSFIISENESKINRISSSIKSQVRRSKEYVIHTELYNFLLDQEPETLSIIYSEIDRNGNLSGINSLKVFFNIMTIFLFSPISVNQEYFEDIFTKMQEILIFNEIVICKTRLKLIKTIAQKCITNANLNKLNNRKSEEVKNGQSAIKNIKRKDDFVFNIVDFLLGLAKELEEEEEEEETKNLRNNLLIISTITPSDIEQFMESAHGTYLLKNNYNEDIFKELLAFSQIIGRSIKATDIREIIKLYFDNNCNDIKNFFQKNVRNYNTDDVKIILSCKNINVLTKIKDELLIISKQIEGNTKNTKNTNTKESNISSLLSRNSSIKSNIKDIKSIIQHYNNLESLKSSSEIMESQILAQKAKRDFKEQEEEEEEEEEDEETTTKIAAVFNSSIQNSTPSIDKSVQKTSSYRKAGSIKKSTIEPTN